MANDDRRKNEKTSCLLSSKIYRGSWAFKQHKYTPKSRKTNGEESPIASSPTYSYSRMESNSSTTGAASPSTHNKGNDGTSSRRRRKRSVLQILIVILLVYVGGSTLWQSHVAPSFVPDVTFDEFGNEQIRRRPGRHRKRFDPTKTTTVYDAILEGYLTLIDVDVSSKSLIGDETKDNEYTDVYGTFCKIDWTRQRKDPSKVPMFKDLIDQSELCQVSKIRVDLWKVAREAQDFDFQYLGTNHSTHAEIAKTITSDQLVSLRRPAGVVFHESRCGSTLAANLLAVGVEPRHVRVYSESPPPVKALKACDNFCNSDKHEQLIRDVLYLMGRKAIPKRDAEGRHYYFLKFQSISALYLEKLTAALPQVPWVFMYRDSVEVMQSNLQKGTMLSNPPCLRSKPMAVNRKPKLLVDLVQDSGKTFDDLSREEYCAAHLSTLAESALRENAKPDSKGMFVNYNQLPEVMWKTVIPQHFHLRNLPDEAGIARMKHIAQYYSKGRGEKAGLEWQVDAAQKQAAANDNVRSAVQTFLEQRYRQMESERQKSTRRER